MDWFKEAVYVSGQLVSDIYQNKVTQEQVQSNPLVSQKYDTIKSGSSYITLKPSGKEDPTNGWKFHLSVDPTQIKEAFNHIAGDLMKEGVAFKVGTEKIHAGLGDESNPQKGKGIVIYAADGVDMRPILQRVEQKLTEAGIRPGTSVNNDKKLGNSNFMYYRNDSDHDGNYIAASRTDHLPEDQKFNPYNKPDPYQNLNFSARPAAKPVEPAVAAAPKVEQPTPARPMDTGRAEAMRYIASLSVTETVGRGNYLGVGQDVETLRQSLTQAGAKEGTHFTVKEKSSLNNGGPVIVLTEQGEKGIKAIQDRHQAGILLANSGITNATKGKSNVSYLGVGASAQEFDDMKKALEAQGLKQNVDYHITPSSANNGKDVISLSSSTADHINALQKEHGTQDRPGVQPAVVTKPATPAAAAPPPSPPPAPPTPPAQPVAAAAEPAKPARVTPESSMAAASERAREQLAEMSKPAAAKPPAAKLDVDLSEPHIGTGSGRISAAGSKVDGHSGRAQLAVEVAAAAAKGNYAEAATTAAVAIAEQQGIKFVAKRVPVIGGLVTAGMTLWSAGAQAAQGNWKKAGSELTAGAAETAGNIVGFGLGDAAREGARKAMLMAGVKEENAPDKSGLRQAAETAYDLGKTIKNAAQLKSMSNTELAQTIQKDPVLPDHVNLKGKQVTLAQAMEDKTFRTSMIKNMEAAAQKDPSMNARVAALKEYGARMDAADAAKPQGAAAKATAAAAQPAAIATASAAKPIPNAAPSAATVIAEAQYKSMTTTQLASAIQKDPTLVDTVKVGGKEVQLSEALKDKDFRKDYLSKLEKMDAAGTDMDKQIAMIKAYEVALEKPQSVAPATQMAQQAPRVNTTPAMA